MLLRNLDTSSSKFFFALAHSERRIVFTESLWNEAASRSKVAVVPPPKPMTISSAGAGLFSLDGVAAGGGACGGSVGGWVGLAAGFDKDAR